MRKLAAFVFIMVFFCLVNGSTSLAAPLFESTLGISHHFSLNAEQDAKDIDAMAAAGFRIIRYDMLWEQVERTKGTYDFSAFDRLVAQMLRRGIRPLFILDYGNRLYGADFSVRTSEARAAFARFAAAAAARYKGKNVIWEIWNEPNNEQVWRPRPNPSEYLQLVVTAATAIRCEDQGAYILGGSVSGVDLPFLTTCIENGMLKYVDAISVHPYREQQPEMVLREYQQLADLIQRHQPAGKKVPFVAGEWGYSMVPGRSEDEQARYLLRMMLFNVYAGSGFTIWYDFRDDGTERQNREHNFGLFRHDGTEKIAIALFKNMTKQLSGKQYVKRVPSRQNDYLLEFADKSGKSCIVAWTTAKDHLATIPGQAAVSLTQNPQFFGCQ